jgi:ATP-dependent Lon protease
MSNNSNVYDTHSVPIIELKDTVIFPKGIVPVLIGKDHSKQAVEKALINTDKKMVFVKTKNCNKDKDHIKVGSIGIIASILHVIKMPNGTLKVLLEGISRGKILSSSQNDICTYVDVEILNTGIFATPVEIEAIWRNFCKTYEKYSEHGKKLSENIVKTGLNSDEMEFIVDTVASHVPIKIEDKQEIINETLLENRIKILTISIQNEIEIIGIEEKIRNNVQSQIESAQKEYYLSEQLKAIQKELKRDTENDFCDKSREKAKKLNLPEEPKIKLESEINRLEQMHPTSAEATVSRGYIDWIISLPWSEKSKDNISISKAQKILDEKHFGLDAVKEKIIELIAAKKYGGEAVPTPIICLAGPPGVGKTSLGKSIANSLNREFVRVSLGGIRDEAEIRGHRKTYIGSMPGKIIQGMKKTKTINPVVLLDEIDKIGHDIIHGDPASALLEVLDPEQNKNFTDNYIDTPYDLSNVLFILTANCTESILHPLLDRMEIINISGYTKGEKLKITKNFLIPKQLKLHSVQDNLISFTDNGIDMMIEEYTREAGLRNIERLIIKCIRKILKKELQSKKKQEYVFDQKYAQKVLGAPAYKKNDLKRISNNGIATGLAWTEEGGDVLEIEVAITSGKGNLTLTGQLGDVMQESAQAALTYLKTKATKLKIPKKKFSQVDIHIHVPEGAIPKDGPSAGITMCSALISAFCKTPTKRNVAMTGEITLQGRVLPVGGIKEKILAAQSYGYDTVILPEKNKYLFKNDKNLRQIKINVVYVNNMNDVVKKAFETSPFTEKRVVK